MNKNSRSTNHSGNSEGGDKDLWKLMGSASKVEVGPMFSRNVLREVRNLESEGFHWKSLMQWLARPAFLVAASTVLVLSGIALLQNQPEFASNDASEVDSYDFVDPAEEFESIEMLGELMAVSDPGQLSDEALMNLLF